MELEVFARIVQRWWTGILAALVVGALLGFTYAESQTPIYQTGTDLLIGPLSADSNVLRAAGQTAQTYAELASASSTLDLVADELGEPSASDATVTATASDVTRILKVRVRADDAQLATDIANAIAAELERVGTVEVAAAQTAGGSEDPSVYRVGDVRVLEAASTPVTPISPNTRLIIALGGLAMMVAVTVAVVAYEYTRQAVRVIGDVERTVPGSLVGRIERSSDRSDDVAHIAVLGRHAGATATSLRGLSVDLVAQIPTVGDNATLVISGADAHDLSGDVAINLAAALADTGRRVALIDANEATGEVRERIWPSCEHPVEPLDIPIDDRSEIVLDGRLTAIEAGVLDLYSSSLAVLPERADLEAALDDLGAGYDHVIVHTAPAFGSAATSRWAAAAAASVLVVSSDIASGRTVQRCAATLGRAARNFLGVVFDERRPALRPSLLRRLFGGGNTPAARPVTSGSTAAAGASTASPARDDADDAHAAVDADDLDRAVEPGSPVSPATPTSPSSSTTKTKATTKAKASDDDRVET